MDLNSDILPIEKEPLQPPNSDVKHSLDHPKKDAKRKKGTGDTDTTGKHSVRFKAYSKAISEGKLNPSINALSLHEYQGKKIGKTTAKLFLEAMNEAGLIERFNVNGKTSYRLAKQG